MNETVPRSRLSWIVRGSLVVILVGFFLAILSPRIWTCVQESDISRCESQMRHLSSVLETWIDRHKALPSGGLQELTSTDAETGEPWLVRVPRDPWGQPFRLTGLESGGTRYLLASAGDDGLFDTGDDIVWPRYTD